MRHARKPQGVTLTELVVTLVITAIITMTVGIVMLDSHRGWLDSWRKMHGGAADDAAMAQAAFEKIVRKASRSKYLINGRADLTVYYYDDWQNSVDLDRYARFYRPDDDPAAFYVEHGTFDGTEAVAKLSQVQLCSTVVDAEFKPVSGGIEMKLALDDGRESTLVLATGILHNE